MTLCEFQHHHGARVRRSDAMRLLVITNRHTFNKVVDANPGMRHRIPGEGQYKYLTAVIYNLLANPTRCATEGEDVKKG